jgi:TorA maturation chaperone TorD
MQQELMDCLARLARHTALVANALMRESSPAFVQEILDYAGELPQIVPFSEVPASAAGTALIRQAFADAGPYSGDKGIDDLLAADYASLLLGVGAHCVAPYESVHRGEDGVLFEKYYFDVLECYRQSGYSKPQWFDGPEDHIGCELAFMSTLYRAADECVRGGDTHTAQEHLDAASAFKQKHLDKWSKCFCEQLILADSDGFYAGIAQWVLAFDEAVARLEC